MSSPFISICIPAFKAERFLAETLASVRAQTFADWELIVTEDGSQDGTERIVRDFAATVSQSVTFERHAQNRGLPATRNTGISSARGTWIALLDSDDLWTPDHLEVAVASLRRHPADLVHGGSILFDSDSGRDLGVRAPTPEMVADFPRSLFSADYVIQPSSVLLRRTMWERVGGFDPSFRYVEDREMWLRCARAGATFLYTRRETCRYRKHAGALTRHAAAMALASAEVLEKNADWEALPVSLRRNCAAAAWRSAGRILLRQDARSAQRFFSRALHHRPAPVTFAYWLAASAFSLAQKSP